VEPEIIKKTNPFANIKGKQMVDEDSLLQNDKVKVKATESNCATKTTACKNCSCGRKE